MADPLQNPLAGERCVPCEGGIPPLSPEESVSLLRDVPAWSLLDGCTRLERRFKFEDFAAAFAFVGRVATIAEAENHHPDLRLGWGYGVVSIHTHAIKGLSRNDFILAAKIDRDVP
jgi:4a-hydroxytetrahydrobiopterin dehydratase